MQLAPGETFTVVRQLDDPNDSGTYYVKATIRDAATDAVLDTLYLTDQGGQRFSKTWTVYSKRSQGFYIAVCTQVFTDSGYTTYSTVYGQEVDTYLVEQRVQHFGGGGGDPISYNRIKQIVEEVIKGLQLPQMPDIGPIVAKEVDRAVRAAEAAHEAVSGVEVAPVVTVNVPKVDLGPVLAAIEEARAAHLGSAEAARLTQAAIEATASHLTAGMADLLKNAKESHGAVSESLIATAEAGFEDIKNLVEALATPPIERVRGVSRTLPTKSPEELIRELRINHG